MNTMTETSTAIRCLPLASREYEISFTGKGFSGFGGSDFVGTDVQAVVGTIGWRTSAMRVTHAPMPTAKPAFRTNAVPAVSPNAVVETSYPASQAATKQSRINGLAKAAEDADRGVEGTARERIPV
jgi:hypothetical protein